MQNRGAGSSRNPPRRLDRSARRHDTGAVQASAQRIPTTATFKPSVGVDLTDEHVRALDVRRAVRPDPAPPASVAIGVLVEQALGLPTVPYQPARATIAEMSDRGEDLAQLY